MKASEFIRGTLVDRIERTSSIESFRFKLEGKIPFVPGQFLQVVFDQANKDNRELNKYLSFSSSPLRDYVEVTKRLSQSAFSRKLKDLKTGDRVLFKGPMGKCVFRQDYKKIGFLIGGIGITPVISIVEYIMDRKLDTDVVLFYSNRTEEDIAFRKELDSWKSKNDNLKVLYTTDCKPRDETCIFGQISKDLITGTGLDLKDRVIFIFGPPGMVNAMKDICLEMGCRKEDIQTESFIGY